MNGVTLVDWCDRLTLVVWCDRLTLVDWFNTCQILTHEFFWNSRKLFHGDQVPVMTFFIEEQL